MCVPISIVLVDEGGNDFTHERLGLANHAKDCNWERKTRDLTRSMQHIEKWTTLFDKIKEKEKEQLSDKTNHVHAVPRTHCIRKIESNCHSVRREASAPPG